MLSSRPVRSAVLSALRLLALALGLPAVYLRGRALRGRLDPTALARLFAADNVRRWRARLGRGEPIDASRARALFLLNHVELALVVLIVFVAACMARGAGLTP